MRQIKGAAKVKPTLSEASRSAVHQNEKNWWTCPMVPNTFRCCKHYGSHYGVSKLLSKNARRGKSLLRRKFGIISAIVYSKFEVNCGQPKHEMLLCSSPCRHGNWGRLATPYMGLTTSRMTQAQNASSPSGFHSRDVPKKNQPFGGVPPDPTSLIGNKEKRHLSWNWHVFSRVHRISRPWPFLKRGEVHIEGDGLR